MCTRVRDCVYPLRSDSKLDLSSKYEYDVDCTNYQLSAFKTCKIRIPTYEINKLESNQPFVGEVSLRAIVGACGNRFSYIFMYE